MMKTLRWILIGLAALLVLAASGIAVLVLLVDPNALKPRIEAAVEQATGRRLTLAGPVSFSASLVPTVVAQDVSFANIEGGSRPAMVRVGRVELRLALLPLLSQQVDIRRLLLVDPDILLETDRQGRPNWVLTAPRRSVAPGTTVAPAAPQAARGGSRLDIQEITIEGGRFAWHSQATGRTETLQVQRLDLRMDAGDEPLRLEGRFSLAGLAFTLRGRTAGFLGLSGDRPWPYHLELAGEGVDARIEGALARAAAAQDWHARIAARIAALQRLQPVVDAVQPGVTLPPLNDISLEAALAMQGQVLRPGAVTLSLGAADLGMLREGLALVRLEVAAPAMDQPVRIAGEARLGAAPLSVTGTLGAPAAFLPGAPAAPLPLDIAIEAAGARATLAGHIADPQRFGGAALALNLTAPDVAALRAIAGPAVPALGAVELQARIATGNEGLPAGPLRLSALRLVAPAVALEGELDIRAEPRMTISGHLEGPHLDVDALRAAFAPPAAAPGAPAAPAAPPPRGNGPRRLIPDVPVRLDALRQFDAALRFAVAEMRVESVVYRDLSGTLALEDGLARLDPFGVTLPGGRIAGSFQADARGDAPALQINLGHEGAGIELAPLLAAYRLPAYASGLMDLALAFDGQGADLRTLLAGAHGRLAVAMQGGRIERALLTAMPQTLRGLILPPGAEAGVALRCFALGAPAQAGIVRLETLLLESDIGRLGGSGTIRLRDEAMALRLVPDVRVGPVQLRAPVRVGGTLASPSVDASENAGAAIGAGIGAFLGTQRTPDRGLQDFAQALGGGGAASLPDCATALAAVHAGREAAPAAPQQEAPAPRTAAPRQERAPRPADLLRGLLGGRR